MYTTGVVAVLLLLTVMPGASGTPGRPPPFRTLLDVLERIAQPKMRKLLESEDVQAPPATHLWNAERQTHRLESRPRVERATQHGCVLGTCQIHNLANMLYHIHKSSGKDESRRASDPRGYGR